MAIKSTDVNSHIRFSSLETYKTWSRGHNFIAFEGSNDRSAHPDIWSYLEDNSSLLSTDDYKQGIMALVDNATHWIRPLDAWRAKSHVLPQQFNSLVRHLLVGFYVPDFMYQVWQEEDEIHQKWFIHIGAGKNIRTAPGLPLLFTKKMAHHFMKAPANYTVEEALRWGQVHALGGGHRLVEALRETRLVRDFNNDDFWQSVLRFFVANPMLDRAHVNPVVDYIWNQKYLDRHIEEEDGVERNIGPARPNFSMKDRNPETLLDEVRQWHEQLAEEGKTRKRYWNPSGIGAFQFQEADENGNITEGWRIRELLNSDALIFEGRVLSHCVASYDESCYQGSTSIWTMETGSDETDWRKVLTIEVSLDTSLKRIIQIRGKHNRLPTFKEKNLIEKWALQEKLRMTNDM